MRALYKNKLFLMLLFILILFRTLNFPYYNSRKPLSTKEIEKSLFIQYTGNNNSIIFRRLQPGFEPNVTPHIALILNLFLVWTFALEPSLAKLIIIDIRERIITLITSYFGGSKYKDSLSF